jgi:hypothetical protein
MHAAGGIEPQRQSPDVITQLIQLFLYETISCIFVAEGCGTELAI